MGNSREKYMEHRFTKDEPLLNVIEKWKAKYCDTDFKKTVVEQVIGRHVRCDLGIEPRDTSSWYFDMGDELEGEDEFINDGYIKLLEIIAKNLTIRLNSPVKKIDYSKEQKSKNKVAACVETESEIFLVKKAVVVTLPLV